MRRPLRVLWPFAVAGVAIGVVVGVARRDAGTGAGHTSTRAQAAAGLSTAWADTRTLADLAQCSGRHAAQANPSAAGVSPKDDLRCTLADGARIEITTWPDTATQARARASVESSLAASGASASYATGPGWWAGAEPDAGVSAAESARIATLLAGRLAGGVIRFGPAA